MGEAVDLVGELVLVDLGVVVELREARVEHLANEQELLLQAPPARLPHLELLRSTRSVEGEELLDGRSPPGRSSRERLALEAPLEAVLSYSTG